MVQPSLRGKHPHAMNSSVMSRMLSTFDTPRRTVIYASLVGMRSMSTFWGVAQIAKLPDNQRVALRLRIEGNLVENQNEDQSPGHLFFEAPTGLGAVC